MVPFEKADTKLFKYYFKLFMKALDEIFVVAKIFYNHICNRKACFFYFYVVLTLSLKK